MLPTDTPVEVVVYPQRGGAERRRAPRYRSDRLALVLPDSGQREVARQALARDVSVTGVSLYVEWQYPAGTLLAVAPVNWPGPRVLTARVVRSTAEGDGWAHGCEWLEPLREFEIDAWQKRP
jgi:PilZ domain-containing protein